MTDREQRLAWATARAQVGFTDGDVDPSKHPVFAQIADLSVAVMLLPADPLAPVLDFADALQVVSPYVVGQLARSVSQLEHEEITGTHLFRASRSAAAGETVMAVGLARHGGAFAGVGRSGRYLTRNDQPAVRLTAIVGATRAALTTQAELISQSGKTLPSGPWELTIATPGATGAVLGAYAPRWQPVEDQDPAPTCTMDHPMVRLEIPELPDPDGLSVLLSRAMSRAVNIFGTTTEFYAPPGNPGEVAAGY